MSLLKGLVASGLIFAALQYAAPAVAQSDTAFERMNVNAQNKPLKSLSEAAEKSRSKPVKVGPPREVANYRGQGRPPVGIDSNAPDPVLQNVAGSAAAAAGAGFPGTSNSDNGAVLGFRIAPPDTDGHIGGANGQYFVQMINLLTTIFDDQGGIVEPPFASNEIWTGIGGNCESFNQGDPIVLYDDQADRWLFSQFAFPDNYSSFSQCVAISQTDDPTGGYNRYEFSFNGIGLNDYPKHGIVNDSITLMANIFKKRGQSFRYGGTYLAVLDKNAMYNGFNAEMRGFNIGTGQFGFVAGDLDGPGTAPALFATAMTTSNRFDIWQIDPNWGGGSASINQVSSIPITPYDGSLCGASRGACIPQPGNGSTLESLSDRLMHRLQIRDFGTHKSMLAAHTVDVGGGRAGIRWYEFRQTGGDWFRYQEGTYAPDDGQYRWMPSIAMNGRGDIGMGFLLGGPSTFMSVSATGQTASASSSGMMDAAEISCVMGGGVQTGTGRSGDYSSTSVDPGDDITFWHTNEYVEFGGDFVWDTWVCPFTIGSGSGGNNPPTAVITLIDCSGLSCDFDGSGSFDSDGSISTYAWDFGDGSNGSGALTSHDYADPGGTFSVVLTVTDNDGGTDSSDAESITVAPPGDAVSVSVASIQVNTLNRGGGRKSPRATVTVVDNLGDPAGSYTVTGDFTGDAAQSGVSGTTNGSGVVTLTSPNSKKGKVSFEFCVTGIEGAFQGALNYQPADNVVTCASN